jgi:hypothetical protein
VDDLRTGVGILDGVETLFSSTALIPVYYIVEQIKKLDMDSEYSGMERG